MERLRCRGKEEGVQSGCSPPDTSWVLLPRRPPGTLSRWVLRTAFHPDLSLSPGPPWVRSHPWLHCGDDAAPPQRSRFTGSPPPPTVHPKSLERDTERRERQQEKHMGHLSSGRQEAAQAGGIAWVTVNGEGHRMLTLHLPAHTHLAGRYLPREDVENMLPTLSLT